MLLILAIGSPIIAMRQAQLKEDAEMARGEADIRSEELRLRLYASSMVTASIEASNPEGIPKVEQWIPEHKNVPDLRNWEWYYASSVLSQNVGSLETNRDQPSFCWTRDSDRLVSLEGADSLIVFDIAEKEVEQRILIKEECSKLQLLTDEERVSFHSGQGIHIWSLKEGIELRQYPVPISPNNGYTLSPDGATLALAHGPNKGHVSDVDIWEAGSEWSPEIGITTRGRPLRGIGWSPDGAFLAAATQPFGFLGIFSSRTGERLREDSVSKRIGGVNLLKWSRDSQLIAVALKNEVSVVSS